MGRGPGDVVDANQVPFMAWNLIDFHVGLAAALSKLWNYALEVVRIAKTAAV